MAHLWTERAIGGELKVDQMQVASWTRSALNGFLDRVRTEINWMRNVNQDPAIQTKIPNSRSIGFSA